MSLFDDLFSPRPAIWTVSELTAYIKQLFELDFRLQEVELTGEISNFVRAGGSGHLYFTLKDASSQIKCAMWRTQANRLRFQPKSGDAVIVRGRVSVYEAGGQYQLYVDSMRPLGRGDLASAFEQLRGRLEEEGLFNKEFKQPIPRAPRRVGIVTSKDAAALRDILTVLRRRNPLLSVLVAPTLVQGEQAPEQIIRALQWLDARDDIDTIILARGGGSMEDLWAFNDERLARAIFAARHPIICGVGHETDFTIADFVADLRAPTPSAAAELVAPDLSDMSPYLALLEQKLDTAIDDHLIMARREVRGRAQMLNLLSPRRRLDSGRQRTDILYSRLGVGMSRRLERSRSQVAILRRGLEAVNPTATLARGFAIVRNARGEVVRSVVGVSAGERIQVQVSDGAFDARVVDGD